MSIIEMLLRLVTAAALGSLIGSERDRLLWAAGIRTHMLVCVGSRLIMTVSQYGFSSILNGKNVVLDSSRIAAHGTPDDNASAIAEKM
jgi:putative Mg2+ transporter-C (MgtC) family protein